jgi:hypothetical protein
MKCQKCQRDIPEDESFEYLGQILCDDCYMDAKNPSRACDPWAVYSATRTREGMGATDVEGLTLLQQAVISYIKGKGKATPEEIMANFNLTQRNLEDTFATLRHCELIKGRKEGDRVYIVPFN